MNSGWIAKTPKIFCISIRLDEFRHNRPHEQLKYSIDIVPDQGLGKWGRLDEEEPVKVAGGELSIGCFVHVVRRADVHHNEFGDSIRMVERQTMGHEGAAIVANNGELPKAELLHDFDLVQRHGAL